jgi:hypothetical protein
MMIEKWAALLQRHQLHDGQFSRTTNAFDDIVHDFVTDESEPRRRFTPFMRHSQKGPRAMPFGSSRLADTSDAAAGIAEISADRQ